MGAYCVSMEMNHSELQLAQNDNDRVEVVRDDGVRFTAVDTLTGKKGHKTSYELAKVDGQNITQLRDYTVESKVEAREMLVEAATEE